MALTFYAHPLSTSCAKVRIVLRLKAIEFDEQLPQGGSYTTSAYRELVPAGSVPAIKDGSFVLHDSDAIIEYLDERFPSPCMKPSDLQIRAYHRSVSRYHDTRLEPALRRLFPFVGEASNDRANSEVSAVEECLSRLAGLVNPSPYLQMGKLCLADCAYPTTLFMIEDVSSAIGQGIELPRKLKDWQSALYEDRIIQEVVDQNRSAIRGWIGSKTKDKLS